MLAATIVFSNPHWLWPGIIALVLALALLIWSYHSTPAGAIRWACLALKVLGLAALLTCLLEPMWSTQRARPGANLFAIIADNSQGLQIKDRGARRNRGEVLRELLDPQRRSWQGKLEENFELRRYLFDARLQATKDFSELAFDGRSSAIGLALRTLNERYRGRPPAGV